MRQAVARRLVARQPVARRLAGGLLVPALLAPALLFFSGPAHAHATAVGVGDLLAGLLHVVTGLEHVLPILALGLLAGRVRVAVLGGWSASFIGAFLVFAVLGAAGRSIVPLPDPGTALPASGALLGLWLALSPRPGRVAWIAVALVVGALHGLGNGQARTDAMSLPAFVAGAALGAQAIAGIAMLVADAASASRRQAVDIALRALGSWIAAIGVLVVALALR
ncbi:MAG: HupE/UreJ family protein [Lautropia sp.]